MTDLTLDELDKFKLWLMKEQKYGINTANGIIADIKTVCREATPKIQFPNDYIYWKKYKQTKASKFKTKKIVTLTKDEIEKIENLELTEKHLINARRWLIIGVNTAQRGSELLELTKDSFKYDKSGSLVIDFSQSKVGQAMRIPALKRVKKLYESEKLPYKISIQKLNNHLKTLGKKAKIVDLIDWKLKEKVIVNDKQVMRHVQKTRPKYEYIASHIFRRTFCTYYMEMGVDEADIRKISGHKSKEMLMNYVREARPDFSEWEKFM
jgi:integrase